MSACSLYRSAVLGGDDDGVAYGVLEKAGMKVEAVYDAFTEQEPQEESERVYIVARECMK